MEKGFPRCRKCGDGILLPLSDFERSGTTYQAWLCTNLQCLYNLKSRDGEIIVNGPLIDGSLRCGGQWPRRHIRERP